MNSIPEEKSNKSKRIEEEIINYHQNLSYDKRGYWHSRGIQNETLDKIKIGWNEGYYIFPYKDRKGNYIGYKAISIDKKFYWKPANLGNPIFNIGDIQKAKEENKTLIIAEGEKDSLVLIQEGYLTVAISSVAGMKEGDKEYFKELNDVVICLDNDEAGRKSSEKVSATLGHMARVVIWSNKFSEKFDINELYLTLYRDFKKTFDKIIDQAKPLADAPDPDIDNKLNELLDYWNKTRGKKYIGLDTGFSNLNEKLSGLRDFVILMGMPGTGKSAFALQIASTVLENRIPVLYYDFDNGEKQLYNRLISRMAHVTEKELRLTGICEEKKEKYEKALERFQRMEQRLYLFNDRELEMKEIYEQIDRTREKSRQDKILLIFDSFQKLPLSTGREMWLRNMEEIRDETNAVILLIYELSDEKIELIEYSGDVILNIYRLENEDQRILRLEVLGGRFVEPGLVGDYKVNYPYWEFLEMS